MKKITLALLLSAVCLGLWAVPAKPGLFKLITLADGSQLKVELCGDDHRHFWRAEDGRTFVLNTETQQYVQTEIGSIPYQYEFNQTRQFPDLNPAKTSSGAKKVTGEPHTEPLVGNMKGLVILAQFSDLSFEEGHDNALYQKIVNEIGYSDADLGFVGSVRDYFLAQSDNQLDYEFDIVGPVTLPQTQKYYGQNGTFSSDKNMKQFVLDALDAAKDQVDFSQYDNDGNGYVDEVFFIYAGKGEADSGDANTIWPHMYYLKDGYGKTWSQNGVTVNVYACGNEIQGDGRIDGVGTMCHEFSHCLGLPDLYDTTSDNSGDAFNMGDWSLMSHGCYNGDQYCPCGYTAYEREFCGWRTIQTVTEATSFENIPSIAEGGTAYKMINNKVPTEYFVLEPRKKINWDACLPGSGLLVYHVDYSAAAWISNTVSNSASHPRFRVVDANNDNTNSEGDLYGVLNDELSDITTPDTKLFNKNSDNTYNLGQSVYQVRRDDDGNVSFKFMPDVYTYEPEKKEGALFYESFNHCFGKGGNDGSFNTGNSGIFRPDQDGWTVTKTANGCHECASFSDSKIAKAVTPEFEINGACVLTFKTAPTGSNNKKTKLAVASGDATLSQAEFATTKGEWTECSVTLTGAGSVSLQFSATKGFYLDEVLVMPYDPASIESVDSDQSSATTSAMYNLAGQQVDNDYHGVVVINGRKVLR